MANHLRKWLLILLAALAGCATTTNEQLIKKQLSLSAEQKLRYDRVFFNEIWLWNQTSWHYGDPPSGPKRQKEFESMAERGYLPAYVALKMFNFENKTKAPDTPAFNLLRQAADAGDVSSACALVPIWAWNNIDGYPRSLSWAVPYIEQGTKAGHFACLEQMAELYRKKLVNPPNWRAEKLLLLRAAQGGYIRAYMILHTRLEATDKILVDSLDRSLCWNAAYYLYTPWVAIHWTYYKAAARGAYPQLGLTDSQRAEVARLTEKWLSRMKSAKVIMDIVNECIALEGGVQ